MGATTTYKRRKIANLDDLDKEEARLRKKAKQIEKEWVALLDPQQWAIDLALGFATNKIMGNKSPLNFITSLFSSKKKKTENKRNNADHAATGKGKKSRIGKILKGAGIALMAMQAVKLFVHYKQKKKREEVLRLQPAR